ncbi:MAG: MBL fold metallo-hydrolase [Oceanospirillaceae bacterium]|nr:MBL fold metallo-hydrolase [Oceanospirillaceae bacterium]MBT12704.1 MBL fold metallo-hydrolase [Oceanospirillaceae bacterium]|tara:strand:+ start:100812 stop:101771 length:960 start_codon:yes stop_codon:yes gene_type:complete
MQDSLYHDPDTGVFQLDADYIAPGLASVYLLRQNNRLAVIETGSAATVAQILQGIEQQGLTTDDVDWVILTHIHLDHAAGAGALMQHCANAKLLVHPRGVRHMVDPAKLEAGTRAVYGDEKYEQLYGRLIPVDESRVVPATDGMTVDFHGRTLTFYDTPGHAMHHVCIHDSLSNGVFSGDTFGLSYRQFDGDDGSVLLFVTTTPVHFDPQAMRASIERIVALQPAHIYLTHYGRIAPSDDNVRQLLHSLDAFVAIAEAEKNHPQGRTERMATAISDWLYARIQARNLPLDEDFCRRWLSTDANLNAQGLDVWLSRQYPA